MDTFALNRSAAETIRQYAAASEEAGKLHPAIIDLIEQEKWFKLYLPERSGGINTDLPSILRLLESIAMADGSTGWTVTLCSGASWFAGFLNDEVRNHVFDRADTCVTGSGAVGGTAVEVPGGYLINGTWKYASGALHATHFTANCALKASDGTSYLDENGEEIIRSFIFDKKEVNTTPTWSYIGMVGTGSHGFQVNDLLLPEDRAFQINGDLKMSTNAGNYPFLQLAEATLAVNFSGMALHFFELAANFVLTPDNLKRFPEHQIAILKQVFEDQKQLLLESRKEFFNTSDESWQKLQCNALSESILADVSRTSRLLARVSRELTDKLYPYCGMEAARKGSVLNRIWRDIHTASQHSLLTFMA